jgi:Fur family transcriptional regulator, peroxide stress response regulator
MEKKIAQVLRENRIRVTPQRILVYGILNSRQEHPTVELIYSRLKEKHPSVSLATVYTILELFKRKNLVRELRIRFDKSSFDSVMRPHHHFLCRKCGRITDVDMPPCIASRHGQVDGNIIEEFHGYFYGLCNQCRAPESKSCRGRLKAPA